MPRSSSRRPVGAGGAVLTPWKNELCQRRQFLVHGVDPALQLVGMPGPKHRTCALRVRRPVCGRRDRRPDVQQPRLKALQLQPQRRRASRRALVKGFRVEGLGFHGSGVRAGGTPTSATVAAGVAARMCLRSCGRRRFGSCRKFSTSWPRLAKSGTTAICALLEACWRRGAAAPPGFCKLGVLVLRITCRTGITGTAQQRAMQHPACPLSTAQH
eukprot:364782-Chlamydomonas_euryale.AAC.10